VEAGNAKSSSFKTAGYHFLQLVLGSSSASMTLSRDLRAVSSVRSGWREPFSKESSCSLGTRKHRISMLPYGRASVFEAVAGTGRRRNGLAPDGRRSHSGAPFPAGMCRCGRLMVEWGTPCGRHKRRESCLLTQAYLIPQPPGRRRTLKVGEGVYPFLRI